MKSATSEELNVQINDLLKHLTDPNLVRSVSPSFKQNHLATLQATIQDLRDRCELLKEPKLREHLLSPTRWELIEVCKAATEEASQLIRMNGADYDGAQGTHVITALNSRTQQFAEHDPAICMAYLRSIGAQGQINELKQLIIRADKSKEACQQQISDSKEAIRIYGDARIVDAEKRLSALTDDIRVATAEMTLESVEKEFGSAAKSCGWLALLWFIVGGLAFGGTLWVAFEFLSDVQTSQAALLASEADAHWYVLGPVLIRVAILSALLGLTTFLLRPLKAYLHMHAANRHRQRVAKNYMAILKTAERQDRPEIIRMLVGTLATFGISGLVEQNDDSLSAFPVGVEKLIPR